MRVVWQELDAPQRFRDRVVHDAARGFELREQTRGLHGVEDDLDAAEFQLETLALADAFAEFVERWYALLHGLNDTPLGPPPSGAVGTLRLVDQAKALQQAADASELRLSGRLSEAEPLYRAALAMADPRHYRTPDIHAEYASLLTRLSRPGDAEKHYEWALKLELQNDPDEASAPVVAARYCLGEHYLRLGEPESARRVIAPSLAAAEQPLAWIVEAEALFLSGEIDDARAAGERALQLASSSEQRERIQERLAELWP